MEQTVWKEIYFVDSITDYTAMEFPGHVVHILCLNGSMSFIFQNVRYNIVAGDYVILVTVALASEFSESDDFKAIVMSISETFITSIATRSSYGIIGHMALLQNPIMQLSSDDLAKCQCDMERLQNRLNDKHLFREEMLGHLLMAHIFDLYDIHARGKVIPQVPERTRELLRKFIELLCNGEYMQNRDLSHYASILCVTPHYLTEICKKVSGKPASYWIDNFTFHKIMCLLQQKELPLSEITSRLNFSSLSYFRFFSV